MADDRAMRELTRALDRNTKALDALHSLTLEVERSRRSEREVSAEEIQRIAKKAVQNVGSNYNFCTHCQLIECTPNSTVNNWTAVGCNCCRMNHDLIPKD